MDEDEMSLQKPVGETRPFFLFEIDGELYAIAALLVERVMKIPPITPVPNSPQAIIGIFHLRGQVVVVLDLIARMKMPKNKPLTANFLCVIYHNKSRFAVLVDHPKSIVEVEMASMRLPDAIVSAHVPSQYIEGVFMFDDVFSAQKKRKSIILGPAGLLPGVSEVPTTVRRPVLWLNVDLLLNKEDFEGVFTSQQKPL